MVAWMGAMQAQDFSMAEWAIGARLLDTVVGDVENAINNALIIRTHLMRPTWHFVAVGDIYWLLKLTAPRIRSALKSRQKFLEISGPLILKINRLLEKELGKKGAQSREELVAIFKNAGIRTDENRFAHLMLNAELDGIICSGAIKNGKQTYDLLQRRVPDIRTLTQEESLAELAKRYFTSHGPATEKDFTWWSGLSTSDVRQAMEFVHGCFHSETSGAKRYWFKESSPVSFTIKNSVFLLPAYDEFLIGYSDRSPSLSLTDNVRTVSSNGIFRPVIVVNGQVAGLWRRMKEKNKVVIELLFFQSKNKSIHRLAEKAASRYREFLGVVSEVKIK